MEIILKEEENTPQIIYKKQYIDYNCTHNQKAENILNNLKFDSDEIFILGGGTSLENFDFDLLRNKITLGINKSFLEFESTLNYSMDSIFYDKIHKDLHIRDKWLNSKSIKLFLSPLEMKKFQNDVYIIKRCLKQNVHNEGIQKGIYGGSNSAFGAIQLSIALGFKKIYLLGYDFCISNDKTHWHEGYNNRDINDFQVQLDRYLKQIELFSDIWEKLGVNIFNCNPNSKLKCFSFVKI